MAGLTLTLLLLPGMMCDARLFAPQIAHLSAGRSIIVADLSRDESIAAMAARVLDEAPPVFALAGLSMGGIVAMEMLRQSPDRIARLALIATNPLAETEEVRAVRAPQMERAKRGDLAGLMTEALIPRYLARPAPDIADLCLQMAADLGPEVFLRQSQALAGRRDQSAVLAAATCPTLILSGELDQLCPPSRHDLMHELMPHAHRVSLPDTGHLPVLENPELTNKALSQWLL
ncbi:alpha/beta fold hydrolase [Yoonia sp.]|uniref:alpha/beta fold hydrolase n=1 Tax=Yoonia sp. TaxID=2212373 RepID=UPI00391B35C6